MTTSVLPETKRVPLQRLASVGTLRAGIVGTTAGASATDVFRVVLFNDTRFALWPLPGVSANTWDASCSLLPTVPGSIVPGFLVCQHKDAASRVVVTEFRLPADPFSQPPTPIQAVAPYGDGLNQQTCFVKLQGGELVVMTHKQDLSAFYSVVRNSSGAWLPQGLVRLSDRDGRSMQFSACDAPWGDLVWACDMFDGEHSVEAATFAFKDGKLTRVATYPKVIDESMGLLANNQEDPSFVAVADRRNGRVCVSYTNTQAPPDGSRQAKPVIAGIKPGMEPTLVEIGTDFVVSILNPSPVIVSDGVTLAFVTGSPMPDTLHCQGTRIAIGSPQFGYSVSRPEFIVQQPDGAVSLVQLDPAAPPIPIPTPEPELGTIICSKMVMMAWIGDDPTGADLSKPGKYTLQWSQTGEEPWNDSTTHFPFAIQSLDAVPMTGKLVKAGGVFYRLRKNGV